MSKKDVETIIGRAILEKDYRTLLFTDPTKALESYDLTKDETQSLENLDREKFDLAASQVEERISKSGLSMGPMPALMSSPLGSFNIDLGSLMHK